MISSETEDRYPEKEKKRKREREGVGRDVMTHRNRVEGQRHGQCAKRKQS